jgi:hypothetical protein
MQRQPMSETIGNDAPPFPGNNGHISEAVGKIAPAIDTAGASPAPTVAADKVRAFRERAMLNGYSLVRVRSMDKAPLPYEWQHGDIATALLNVRSDALNTGLVVTGLRCIDVDVDDPQLVQEIMEAARQHLPRGALIRRRAGSSRIARCTARPKESLPNG